MTQKFSPANVERILSPERQQYLDPLRLLSLVPIRPFHTVVDVGCGPGYILIPLAKYLHNGHAIGLDIQPEMLEVARARVKEVRLANVELVQTASDAKLNLPAESVDGAILSSVLHENKKPVAILKAVAAALRRGGWCAVVEWHKREMEAGPPLEARIGPEQLREAAQKVGLAFKSAREFSERYYLALLGK